MKEIPILYRRSASCLVCQREARYVSAINSALRQQARSGRGPGVRRLAAEYSLSPLSLRRHRDGCLALGALRRKEARGG